MESEQIMNEANGKGSSRGNESGNPGNGSSHRRMNTKHGRTQARQPCHETTDV